MPVKTTRISVGLSFFLLGVLLMAGCDTESYPQDLVYPLRSDPIITDNLRGELNKSKPPQIIDPPGAFLYLFAKLDAKDRDLALLPTKVGADMRAALERNLHSIFGTPAKPTVTIDDSSAKSALKLEDNTLALGSAVYRQHCLHCHGLAGDGRGPTAPWVNPHPRDYRQGIFKFTSSKVATGVRKARRSDLLRTLRNGIEGTSMPSFYLLPDDELEALASYVIHLSLRGEAEFLVLIKMLTDDLNKDLAMPAAVKEAVEEDTLPVLIKRWMDTENEGNEIKPGNYNYASEAERQKSAARGMSLFVKQGEAGCTSCHVRYGRQITYSYDAWGTINRRADLTLGTYRGGRRPADLYYRIHSGINGTDMPAFGKDLSSDQVWDLVNFLQALPYPAMRKELVGEIE